MPDDVSLFMAVWQARQAHHRFDVELLYAAQCAAVLYGFDQTTVMRLCSQAERECSRARLVLAKLQACE